MFDNWKLLSVRCQLAKYQVIGLSVTVYIVVELRGRYEGTVCLHFLSLIRFIIFTCVAIMQINA